MSTSDFVRSEEALLEITELISRIKFDFEGLSRLHHNNSGNQKIYRVNLGSKSELGSLLERTNSFESLLCNTCALWLQLVYAYRCLMLRKLHSALHSIF